MAQSEDIQYSQFDKEGNMFIFEPGAGCTGVPRKVEPGEELHLSSWSEVNVTETSVKSKVQSSMQNIQVDAVQMECSQMSEKQKNRRRYILSISISSECHLNCHIYVGKIIKSVKFVGFIVNIMNH